MGVDKEQFLLYKDMAAKVSAGVEDGQSKVSHLLN